MLIIYYYYYLPSVGQICLMWKWVIDLAKQRYAQWRRAFARLTLIILPMNLSSIWISPSILTHCLRKALTMPFRLNCYSTAISGPDPATHGIRDFSSTFRELGKRSKIVFYAVFWKIIKWQKPVFWKLPIFALCMISLIHAVRFCWLCQIVFISYSFLLCTIIWFFSGLFSCESVAVPCIKLYATLASVYYITQGKTFWCSELFGSHSKSTPKSHLCKVKSLSSHCLHNSAEAASYNLIHEMSLYWKLLPSAFSLWGCTMG